MSRIILIGAGGHARVVIEVLRRRGMTITGAVDADTKLHGTEIEGVPVIGDDREILNHAPAEVQLVNCIGNAGAAIGDSGLNARRSAFETFVARGYRFASVVSPNAVIASSVRIGDGCHLIAGAIVQPGAIIGVDTIVNTGTRIDHDCRIGAHSHIAPGAIVCGAVTIGDTAHIGAGAVIVQGLTIGSGAVVGAGATVIDDVPPGGTVFGVPARPVGNRAERR